jgi:2,3-bisphosphoglycerate-dependent phosphoglycerate mutase
MKTVAYFIRHAEPDYSVHDDSIRPLTDKGKNDALKVAAYLNDKEIEVALSSPYKRAIETIKPFVDTNNMKVELVEDFRERKVDSCWIDDFNEFTKKQWEDFNYKLLDGECLHEVQERNIKALEMVLNKFCGKKIVIGTHGTALSTIINYYESSYGYKDFNEIRLLMPWIVKFTFDEMTCVEIDKINILE